MLSVKVGQIHRFLCAPQGLFTTAWSPVIALTYAIRRESTREEKGDLASRYEKRRHAPGGEGVEECLSRDAGCGIPEGSELERAGQIV